MPRTVAPGRPGSCHLTITAVIPAKSAATGLSGDWEITATRRTTYAGTMPRDASNAEQAVDAAVAALRRAYEDAVTVIETISDPYRAYRHATQLADVLRDTAEDVADLRARNAAQLRA